MIVTRQRQKRRGIGRFILPVLALALLAVAVAWPPSRSAIVDGPLRPAFGVVGNAFAFVVRPFTFAAQQEQITEKNREIARTNQQIEVQRRRADDAESQTKALRAQVTELQNQPVPSAAPAVVPKRNPPAGTVVGGAAGGGPAAAQSDDVRRQAGVWAAMEPEKAAALVRKLPDDQVAAVFAAMPPDAVGPIMETLPADVAARITQVRTTVR